MGARGFSTVFGGHLAKWQPRSLIIALTAVSDTVLMGFEHIRLAES